MKKLFLIFGIIGSLCVTDLYAARENEPTTVTSTSQCPEGCEFQVPPMVISTSSSGGETSADVYKYCIVSGTTGTPCPKGGPTTTVSNTINNSNQIHETVGKRPVASRMADTPNVVKKVVYERIVEGD